MWPIDQASIIYLEDGDSQNQVAYQNLFFSTHHTTKPW